MSGLRIKVNSPILPILTLQLVVMATSLELSDKRGPNLQSTIKCIPCDENVVKIGPEDPEVSLLKCLFKKINVSRTI